MKTRTFKNQKSRTNHTAARMRQRRGDLFEIMIKLRQEKPASEELLEALLLKAGIPQTEIILVQKSEETGICLYPRSPRQAERLERQLLRLPVKNIQRRRRTLYKTQWRDKWKKDFLPFALTPTIDVVPWWRKSVDRSRKRRILCIDTITAFGTGLHETTRFMARLIEDSQGQFYNFLDVGTGTGILSIVAFLLAFSHPKAEWKPVLDLSSLREKAVLTSTAMLLMEERSINGAKIVHAIDHDRQCISVAKRNLAVNGFGFDRIVVTDLRSMRRDQQFDFVAANLISADLIAFKRILWSRLRPGGFLAISGISIENYPWLRREFKKIPLRCIKVKRGKEWIALLFRRGQTVL